MSEVIQVSPRNSRAFYPLFKRGIDVLACLASMPVVLPVVGSIAVLIKLDSSGPVFYTPLRCGRYGQPFRMYKFRTMVPDADRLGGYSTALRDPRITRLGRFLRKYKLDEVPQLLNVLKGDMSLVGPRPEILTYTSWYKGEEKLILTVRPGITDFSSVRFRDLQQRLGECDVDRVFEEQVLPIKNRLRIKYVREQSLSTDLKILFMTLVKIFARPNSDGT